MGLIDFIKNAGASIFGASKSSAAEKEKEIRDFVSEFGLSIENLGVSIDDDVVTLTGEAASQADKEKIVLAAGNIKGVAKVDDQITVAEPEPEAQFYTVQKGDSLSKISKQFYDDYMKYPQIFEANKPMLKDPDLIYPGQVLRIPPLEE